MAYIGRQLVRGQNRVLDDISGSFNGSTTAFNLTVSSSSSPPASVNQLWIILGGVLQKPGTDFTVADAVITFTTAPASTLSFWGMIQGDTSDINSPADASVTPSKIANSGDFAFPADVRFKDADGSHYVGLQAPSTVSSNLVWTLPAADGSANQVLKTDGSGALGWASDANAPEGTAVLSTGESGTTKYLRVDGDGTCSWQLAVDATKATLTGSTNNTICTVTGANAIQGESGLTFDGSTLNFTAASGDARLSLFGTEGNDARITLVADDGDDHIDQWNLRAEAANHFAIDQFASGSFVERLTIGSDAANGDVTVKTGDLIFGTAGKGICLGVTSNTADNTLDDYEEGTHTTTQVGSGGGVPLTNNVCYYTKIGNICHVHGIIDVGASSGSSAVEFSLPFTSKAQSGSNYTRNTFALMHKFCNINDSYKNIVGYVGQNEAYWRIYNVGDNIDWHQFLSGDFTANSAEILFSVTYQTA